MTGFGKVTAELPSKKVTVEIKSSEQQATGFVDPHSFHLQRKRNANTQFVTPVA